MPKVNIADAKAEQLADKRMRAEGAYLRAVGAKEGKADCAFAGTAMRLASVRGLIANVLCASGKGTYDYADVARNAEVGVSDLSYANLAYIANNFAFRADLVGLSVSFDTESESITVRVATADEKAEAIRKGASLTGRTFATVAAVTGFKAAPKAAPRKAAKAAPKADTEAA